MGRARIISEQGEGRYTVEIDYGSAERTRRLERVDMRLYELTLRKTWQADLLADIEAGLPSLLSEMDALILAYVAATKVVPRDAQNEAAIKKQIDDKTVQLNKQRTLIQEARNALSLTELQFKSAELERGTLEQLNLVVEQGAWCADYTEDATGTVATLEINGESGLTLIAPSAPAPAAADGVMVAREMQSPEQVFWNAAVLPGWQKWKPTYRTGTITALNTEADTASVELDAALSSARSLNINQAGTLTAVPVKYMTCNASAFEVGDKCIVSFAGQDQANPKVVGFRDNPKPCAPAFVLVPIVAATSALVTNGAPHGMFDVITSCGDGVFVYNNVIIVPDAYYIKKITSLNEVYFPEPSLGWAAPYVPPVELWAENHGVWQDSAVTNPYSFASTTYNTSYVMGVGFGGLYIRRRTWPFTTMALSKSCAAPVAVASAIVHSAITAAPAFEPGIPEVSAPTTLVDTSDFAEMAAFLGVTAKMPPTLSLTKGGRTIAYELDGVTGAGMYGPRLYVKYKRPGASL